MLLLTQVLVDVPIDPVRVLRDTKVCVFWVLHMTIVDHVFPKVTGPSTLLLSQASQARVATHHQTEHPLFPLHSFPDDVVTSDRRFRVAMALREAGLHDTTYARRIIAAIPPPHPPRPDQQSSLFK